MGICNVGDKFPNSFEGAISAHSCIVELDNKSAQVHMAADIDEFLQIQPNDNCYICGAAIRDPYACAESLYRLSGMLFEVEYNLEDALGKEGWRVHPSDRPSWVSLFSINAWLDQFAKKGI